MRALRLGFLALIMGPFLIACRPDLHGYIGSSQDQTLAYSQIASSSAYSGDALAAQPEFSAYIGSQLDDQIVDAVSLSAYSDSTCSTLATGALSVPINPLPLTMGVSAFSGVGYEILGDLEEVIYLGAELSTKPEVGRCTSGITILQHFSTGNGHSVFQPGGNGAAGAANGVKQDFVYNQKFDSQGRIIAVGLSFNAAGGLEPTMWRYNPNGTLDTNFNGTGVVIFNSGAAGLSGAPNATKDETFTSIQIDSLGRYVLLGYSGDYYSGIGPREMVIWRYNSNGTLDTTFNTVGYVIFNPGTAGAAGGTGAGKADNAMALLIDSSGKYVVGGSSKNVAGGTETCIWRYNTNGTLDTTFNSTGYAVFMPGGTRPGGATNATKSDYPYRIIKDSLNRYVLLGTSMNAAGEFEMTLWAYTSSGALDTSFNSVGYSVFDGGNPSVGGVGFMRWDGVGGLDLDSTGRLVISGIVTFDAWRWEPIVWRYTVNGTLDTTFNGVGYVIYNHGLASAGGAANGVKTESVNGLKVDDQDRYILMGSTRNAAGSDEAVIWRYDSSGSLDTTFNGTGIAIFNQNLTGLNGEANGTKSEYFSAMDLDSRGRIVLTGGSGDIGLYTAAFMIVRYLPDGTLDQ